MIKIVERIEDFEIRFELMLKFYDFKYEIMGELFSVGELFLVEIFLEKEVVEG